MIKERVDAKKSVDFTVMEQVINLCHKSTNELCKLWDKLYDKEPAFKSRQYLISKLVYRIQELAYGGLDVSTEKRMLADAKEVEKCEKARKRYAPSIGTQIIKEYRGQIHEILVVAEGFAYGGAVFKSLPAIATKITGTKWNGLKFFNVGEG